MSLRSNPLSDQQISALNELIKEITPEQLIWLSGFMEGKLSGLPANAEAVPTIAAVKTIEAPQAYLTILYGTETGNSKELADRLAEKAGFKNIAATVASMYDYDYKKLNEEENVAIIVSTHGEGDPPDMADDFHKYLTGKRAPKLDNINYSVLALGDKSYKYFCKTGEDIDAACKELGAFRMASLVKCDVDYENSANIWMNNVLINLAPAKATETAAPTVEEVEKQPAVQTHNGKAAEEMFSEFSKKNPYQATVLEKVKLSGPGSDKEVYHLELSLEGSGITYEPGDSVGIFAKNPDVLVEKILENTGFDPGQIVDLNNEEYTIEEALQHHLEITILSYDMLQKYFNKTKNAELKELLADDKKLDEYLYGHDLLDLLEDFPFEWHANKLVEILRQLPPRLYSISSSMDSVGEEVHATVSVVRYERKNRLRLGACSSHLIDNVEIEDQVPIYIDKNPGFKLPLNGSKLIMVGAGTGIAPYRAFMQQRESHGMKEGTWLFFGDRRIGSDFLYQTEWQKLMETKYLEKMEVAFSRDQQEKIYVQHKLLENKAEVFNWLENGAYFYLCGNMKFMAKDVNKTLLQIIQEQGGMSKDKAKDYVKKLKREKRFQTDVY